MAYRNRNDNTSNTQMREKLSSVLSSSSKGYYQRSAPSSGLRMMKAVDSLIGDGEDHINIWLHGQTEIGRALDPGSHLPLNHSHYGRFISMKNFLAWIGSENRDDRLRTFTGERFRELAEMIPRRNVPNIRAIIADSNYQRIKQYPELAKDIKESTLPFDIYYVNRHTGLRRRPSNFDWFIEIFETIRTALKEDKEPDFTSFMTHKDLPLYVITTPIPEQPTPKVPNKPKHNAVPEGLTEVVACMVKNGNEGSERLTSIGLVITNMFPHFKPKAPPNNGLGKLIERLPQFHLERPSLIVHFKPEVTQEEIDRLSAIGAELMNERRQQQETAAQAQVAEAGETVQQTAIPEVPQQPVEDTATTTATVEESLAEPTRDQPVEATAE